MNNASSPRHISSTPNSLVIEWADGRVSEYLSIWLRDNCPADRDASNGQRLVDITELPSDPRIHSATPGSGGGAVLVRWEGDAKVASFDFSWLTQYGTDPRVGASHGATEPVTRTWLEGASLNAEQDFAWTTLPDLRASPAARATWLGRLLQDGIAFMRGLPAEPDTILEAVAPIGHLLETNYGKVFDVRSVPQPENLAYSDLGLGLHTDNPYREPVPGFQALHVMAASAEGGESLFADGFALAEHLRSEDPEAFKLLTQTAVPFRYSAKGCELYAERPLVQLSCEGAIAAVHYNSRSIAPMRLPAARMAAFYASYRLFAGMLRDPRFQLRLRLRDGDLVAFDNRRILHGRTAFSSARSLRHLRGCYLTRDSVYSEAALLQRNLAPARE
jgi:[2-(trimethylamino)ethyl]phosphonate dioxygenase